MAVHGSTSSTKLWQLFFGTPLSTEADFDPAAESIYGLTAEGSQEREESAQGSQPMKTHTKGHQEEQDALLRERNQKIHGSNNAPHQEVQNLHNMILFKMILNKMHKTINKRNHQPMLKMIPWVKKL